MKVKSIHEAKKNQGCTVTAPSSACHHGSPISAEAESKLAARLDKSSAVTSTCPSTVVAQILAADAASAARVCTCRLTVSITAPASMK